MYVCLLTKKCSYNVCVCLLPTYHVRPPQRNDFTMHELISIAYECDYPQRGIELGRKYTLLRLSYTDTNAILKRVLDKIYG